MSYRIRRFAGRLEKRAIFASLSLLALLLASGALLQVNATSSNNGISSGITMKTQASGLSPSVVSTVSKMGTSPALTALPLTSSANAALAKAETNAPENKISAGVNSAVSAATASFVPPVVSPSSIVNNAGPAKTAKGLNAYDNGAVDGGLDLEPPDQGLCAGNGYVIDILNVEIAVYSESSLAPASAVVSLPALVGFPVAQLFGASPVGGGYILSDPRCLYDAGTGHWFLSFLYFGGAGIYSASGPFPFGPDTYGAEFVLSSTTTSPLGSWNIYAINVTNAENSGIQTNDPNCPCLGDQPLLGADQNALVLDTNEYQAVGTAFNGAQIYLFDKLALASGSLLVNVVRFNTGLIPTPDGSCVSTTGLDCWWSINPAISPTVGSYDKSQKGTAWAISALDFENFAVGSSSGDNRVAIWSFSDTSSLQSASPTVTLNLKVAQHVAKYYDPSIDPKTGAPTGYEVPQKAGVHPLGVDIYSNNVATGCAAKCPVGKIASDDDRFSGSVIYAQGAIWASHSTLVNEGGKGHPDIEMGAAFYIFNAAGPSVSLADQGYVAASNEGITYPAIGVGPNGNGVITFTLSGRDYFPSTAYAIIQESSSTVGTIHIADTGQSPADGFSEYTNQAIGGLVYQPRWGDYSWAVWADGRIFFASEYIQYPNCSPTAFLKDPTCGGTRDPFANWGSSLNSVTA